MELTPYQKNALDLTKHIALTANAGSGKTFVLSKRFVEIILQNDIDLHSVVAITFTEKAASELYKKIAKEIDDRTIAETDAKKLRKLKLVRRQLVSGNISTIHAFCINLLKEFSPQAGIDANFIPVDQKSSDELMEDSLEEYLTKQLNTKTKSEDLKNLIRILGGINLLKRSIKDALSKRKVFESIHKNIYLKDKNVIAGYLVESYKELYSRIFYPKIPRFISTMESINNFVLEIDPANDTAQQVSSYLKLLNENQNRNINEIVASVLKLIFTTKHELRKQKYLKSSENLEMFREERVFIEAFRKLSEFFSEPDGIDEDEQRLADFGLKFLNVCENVLAIYNFKKRKNGFLDFEDMLILSEKLILNNDVKKTLASKYKFIMIDEYQDTNEIQHNIFMPLLDNLKRGNLFVVGDEKQSIYMFRDAEPEIFNSTKSEISSASSPESILDLPHSFRVSPKIACFTNMLFGKLFSDPEPLFNEVEHKNLLSTRGDTETGFIEFILPDDKSNEAEYVSKRINKLVTMGLYKYGNIAVLCRKRNLFKQIEKSFASNNIPYVIMGGKGFYQKQLIYDINSYLKFLLNKDNDEALVSILRSPFFSIPDPVIFNISLRKEESFFNKCTAYSEQDEKLKKVIELLKSHQELFASISLQELIKRILNDTQYWALLANKRTGSQEIANAKKLISIARSFNEQGFKTVFDFIDFLSTSISSIEDESQAALGEENDSVKIMTIHQAKGLEYRVVILFGCNEKIQDNLIRSKSVEINKHYGVLAKLPDNNDFFREYSAAKIVKANNYLNVRKNLAEEKRLLYVGITRAIDTLIISGHHNNETFTNNSFMDLIQQALSFNMQDSSININAPLEFMFKKENQYSIEKKPLNFEIKIHHKFDDAEFHIEAAQDKAKIKRDFNIDPIYDKQQNEIISATKVAIYKQCPMKYHLIYNLGYTFLFNRLKSYDENYNFNYKEDIEVFTLADLRGRVIHAVLEHDAGREELEFELDKILNAELTPEQKSRINTDSLKAEILNTLDNYYNSKIFKEISSCKNSKNEFEIYSREKDYFLYGIIDKLIIDGNSLTIIDYKTDSLTNSNPDLKFENYKPQLMFYSFICSRRFPGIKNFYYKLVFIKSPSDSIEGEFTPCELQKFKDEINFTVASVRKNIYVKNLAHCEKCHFAINSGCVYK